MQINWTVLTYLVVAGFAISGLGRGWWKEAITTFVLGSLVFLLQNPDLAQTLIDTINQAIAAVWTYIPTGFTGFVESSLGNFLAIETQAGSPPQLDPSAPETWVVILLLTLTGSVLVGRLSINNPPTGVGKLLGALLAGINGWLILNLTREYLDGRALPGQQNAAASSELTSVGGSSFGQAAQSVAVVFTGLPDLSVLDSAMPWIVTGTGLLLVFAVLRTRFGIRTSNEGSKLDIRVPPFYKPKPKTPPKDLDGVVDNLAKRLRNI